MRAVLQRVQRASVTVDGEEVGAVGAGLLVFAGVRQGDTPEDIAWTASKIAGLRIFPDDAGRMNRSVREAGAAVLLVSQFTLYGDVRKGRRPSFEKAARPEEAVPALDALKAALEADGLTVPTGRFGAHMIVDLVNDGPVTILLDSGERRRGSGRTGTAVAGARQQLVGDRLTETELVLASASPRRKVLLAELGLTFTVEPADVDEKTDVPEDPEEHARHLAERKARAVVERRGRGIILAADTIVVLDGRIYGKPSGEDEAARMLSELSGREHTVMTGVCVADAGSGVLQSTLVQTRVRFHALSADEIRRYVATGEPLDKAGAYAIQG
ncbi:MAG: D-tyrosyl-tRNA(Tyr) deacylase, partial [Gemmatimonadetes bacterium]|nr:D-tyrosyl-tRNA(Tyr) deacylase [Gemmatimonadota bacterium]